MRTSRPTLGAKKLGKINRVDIKRLLSAKRQAGFSKSTVRLIRATRSALFIEALDENLITASPLVALSRHGRGKRTDVVSSAERLRTIRPLSAEELRAFLTAARDEPEAYPLFLTLAGTGLRPGEAFALQWSDLDLNRREILVERALSAGIVGNTKTSTVRRVDMSQELATTLSRLLGKRPSSQTAGVSCRKGPSSTP